MRKDRTLIGKNAVRLVALLMTLAVSTHAFGQATVRHADRVPVRMQEAPADAPKPPADAKRVTHHGVAFAISLDTLVVSADLVKDGTEFVLMAPNGTTDDATL